MVVIIKYNEIMFTFSAESPNSTAKRINRMPLLRDLTRKCHMIRCCN